MKKLNVMSYKLNVGALLTFTLTISGSAFAQKKDSTQVAFSLQQAIDYAMQNQTKVQNAVYDEQIAQNKVKEITGIGLPQINGSIDTKAFLNIPVQGIPSGSFPIQ